jgi:hypothetical protein
MKRDRDTDWWLTVAGWLPIRIWEHEDPAEAARRLVGLVCERAPEVSFLGQVDPSVGSLLARWSLLP